jgi:amidohydrolase
MIDVTKLVNEIESDAIKHWHHLHANPELSLHEFNTCAYLMDVIENQVDYDRMKRVGDTGVLVELIGTKSQSDKVIGLRGDMDALPVTEKTGLEFASLNDGVMHACGHDVHTTVLLSSLIVLSRIKNQFSGKLVFFFQPAEENLRGAKLFLNDPHIDFEEIDGMAAIHVIPDLYGGQIGTRKGAILASADKLNIKVIGKQCHAAHPNRGVDPIVVAANIINTLQTVVSRGISPLENGIVTIGKINGGVAHNIISESLEMEGTIRATKPETRVAIHSKVKDICENVAKGMGAQAIVDIEKGVPPLICDEEWVDRVFRVGCKLLGEENVINLSTPAMGGEDFAFLKENKPGVFIRLGARTPGKEYGATHSPYYYTDEKAIVVGVKTMVGVALDFFNEEYK